MVRELKLADRVVSAAAREARRRKTPFYLLDARELARQIREWRAAAPGAVFYPYKCNRDERAVRAAAAAGLGAEVTTVDDLRRARRMRLSGARIIVQGPAKPAALLEAGLRTGALFVVDGREDVVALLARAHATGTTPRYLLRLAPRVVGPEQRAFGLPARPLVALARELARRGAPPAEGLAFHLGTGIASAAPFLAALREAAAVARALGALGWPVATLGVGGGFAARLESRGKEPQPPGPSAAEIVPALRRAARRLFDAERNVRLLFEPGRAIVSGAYHLVARVVRVRDGRAPVAYLDASALSHAPFVILGRHPIAVRPRRPGPERRVTLAGPLGVGNDVFARAVRLPPLRPGDLVVIGSVGAYNQNAANTWAGPAAEVRRGPT